MVARQVDNAFWNWHNPARVDHGRADALLCETIGNFKRGSRKTAYGHDEHVFVWCFAEHIHTIIRSPHSWNVFTDGTLRVTNHGRCIVDGHCLVEFFAQTCCITRSGNMNSGNHLHDGEIPDSMMTRTIRSSNSRPVEHECDPSLVQTDIHQHLVESAVHERGIERNHRVQTAIGQPGSRRDCVLLRNAYVKHAVGELLSHRPQTGRAQHCAGDGHEPLVYRCPRHKLVAEHVCPRELACGRQRQTRIGVNLPNSMELVCIVIACRSVTATLFGDGVNNHRSAVVLCLTKSCLHGDDVVPVNGAEVFDVEVCVERLIIRETTQETMDTASHTAIERTRSRAHLGKSLATREVQIAICRTRANPV
ncbi:unannotated protein [freshwater metagenome]|uniref:Unannotated protein n=1 Tax=freshwater metagenome TaxID=449393 RepID=A0A6J6CPB0_9ZZZZ